MSLLTKGAKSQRGEESKSHASARMTNVKAGVIGSVMMMGKLQSDLAED